MHTSELAPDRGASAGNFRLYQFCRRLFIEGIRRTNRSGGKRLSHAVSSGGRGCARATRFAAIGLFALGALGASAMLPADNALAQVAEPSVTPTLNDIDVWVTARDIADTDEGHGQTLTQIPGPDTVFSSNVNNYSVLLSETDITTVEGTEGTVEGTVREPAISYDFDTSVSADTVLVCRDGVRINAALSNLPVTTEAALGRDLPLIGVPTEIVAYAITAANVVGSNTQSNLANNTINTGPNNPGNFRHREGDVNVACSDAEAVVDDASKTYVNKYTVTINRIATNALDTVTFTPSESVETVPGQGSAYSIEVASGTSSGTLTVTTDEATATMRLCEGTAAVGAAATGGSISRTVSGITATPITRRLIVSDSGALSTCANLDTDAISTNEDRVYTFDFTARAGSVSATLVGSGRPTLESPVFLEDDGGSGSFTINVEGYAPATRATGAEFLLARLIFNVDPDGTTPANEAPGVPTAGNDLGNADGSQEFPITDYTIGFDHHTRAMGNQAFFFPETATSVRLIMPKALFETGAGSDRITGNESFTITVTARDTARFLPTEINIDGSLIEASEVRAGGNFTQIPNSGFSDVASGAARFEIFEAGGEEGSLLESISVESMSAVGIPLGSTGGTSDIITVGGTTSPSDALAVVVTAADETGTQYDEITISGMNAAGDDVLTEVTGETVNDVRTSTVRGFTSGVNDLMVTITDGNDDDGGSNGATPAAARTYTIRVMTTQRPGTDNENLSGLSATLGGTAHALLAANDSATAPDTFNPSTRDYSLRLPYNGNTDHDNVRLTASLADSGAMANDGAPVRFCTTVAARADITGDLASPNGAFSPRGATRTVEIGGIAADEEIPVTIYVTAENASTPLPTNCATAATNTDTTATLVTIRVAPAPSGSAVLDNRDRSLLNSAGSTVNVPLMLTNIPARVYDGSRLAALTEVIINIVPEKDSANVVFAANLSEDGTLASVGDTTFSVGCTSCTLSSATSGFDVHVPVASLGRANTGAYAEASVTLSFITDSGTVTTGAVTFDPSTLQAITYATADGPADATSTPAAGTLTLEDSTGDVLFTVALDEFPAFTDDESQGPLEWNLESDIGTVNLPTIHAGSDANTPIVYTLRNAANAVVMSGVAGSNLPAGITFNGEPSGTNSPTLTGTPLAEFAVTEYTLTACDAQNHCTTDSDVPDADNDMSENRVTFSISVIIGPPESVSVSMAPTGPITEGDTTEITFRLNQPPNAESGTITIPFGITFTDATAADFEISTDDVDSCENAALGATRFCTGSEPLRFSFNDAGSPLIAEQEITITITAVDDNDDDNVDGTSPEMVTFKLTEGTNVSDDSDVNTEYAGIMVDAADSVTVTVTDDDEDPTSVSVTVDPAETENPAESGLGRSAKIREREGTATIRVRLNSAATTGTGDVSIEWVFAPIGDNGADFMQAGRTDDYTVTGDANSGCTGACMTRGTVVATTAIVIAEGEQEAVFTVTGVDDSEDEDEGDQSFTFTISDVRSVTGTAPTAPTGAAAMITITLREIATEAVVVKTEIETVTTLIGAEQVGTISGLIRARFTSPVSVVASAPAVPDTATALHLPDNPQVLGDMLNGLGLEHTASADGGGVYAVWARGTYTSMEGDPTVDGMKVDYDGDSTGLGIGVEKVTGRYVAGVAMNWLTTDLDLRSEDDEGLSKYEESLLMVAPYLALRRDNGRSFWISAGYGAGDADGTTAADGATASADVSVSFLNAGADFVLTTHQNGELIGSLSTLAVRKTVDSFTFEGTDTITATTLSTFRGQGEVTYYRTVEAGDGRIVKPYVGLATLHDAGDKLNDDSHALDLRGGGEFHGEKINASLEISTELLRKDHKSWTISGSARYLFSPEGLGASLTLDGAHATDSNMGMEGGYGMMVREVHKDALLTPFAGLKHGSGGNGEFSSGLRLAIGSEMDADLRAARAFGNDEDTLKLNFRRTF